MRGLCDNVLDTGKIKILIFSLLICCSCYDYETETPDYNDTNRILTPEGKEINTGEWTLSGPAGAVTEPLVIPDPVFSCCMNHRENTPFALFNANDEMLNFDYMIEFQPLHTKFNKPVTITFTKLSLEPDILFFELIPGQDPKKSTSWIDITSKFTWTSNEDWYTFSFTTDHFEPVLMTTPAVAQYMFVNDYINSTFPSGYKKPTKMDNGTYYTYMIGHYDTEYFIVYVYFAGAPTSGKTYEAKNSYLAGGFGNTDNAYCEIAGGFYCSVSNGTLGECQKEIFRSLSGEVKYESYVTAGGVTHYSVLFKNAVIKLPSTGEELELNGVFDFF
jgi:hypothetical protein